MPYEHRFFIVRQTLDNKVLAKSAFKSAHGRVDQKNRQHAGVSGILSSALPAKNNPWSMTLLPFSHWRRIHRLCHVLALGWRCVRFPGKGR